LEQGADVGIGIHEGFKIMQDGNYGREKLVYNIA
jgi:hypothetical protein